MENKNKRRTFTKIINGYSIKVIIYVLSIAMLSFLVETPQKKLKPDKPNVLFIAVDDLRPELGCYGKTHIKSPNIDRLANSGMVFNRAYANYPVCGPSRASLLSGIYPSDTRWLRWNCSQDDETPGIVSLPMHFRNNDYETISLGKVYNNFEDGRGSWDKNWRPPLSTTEWDYQSTGGIRLFNELNKNWSRNTSPHSNTNLPRRGLPYEKPDVPDVAYLDGRLANRAIEELQGFSNNARPFFLAVGFHKPHLPFNAPEKYWNMYNKQDIHLPSNGFFPKDAPESARFNWSELRSYYGIPKNGPVPDTIAYNLIHGYYACVSYVDAQIGRVLNSLEDLGLADNTIIVLWGDHGWFLGEHGFWSKHSNFERAAHAPLIVKAPWKDPGLETDALVEFVDIYPTLCELAGLSLPFHLQGESFVKLLDDPDQSIKEAVFYRRGGETIVTKTHAYTEWINYESGQVKARMLYDHQVDPEENVNISKHPENKKLIMALHIKLHEHLQSRNNLIIR